MKLALKFARRYLFGRSRLGAANWVCILSVLAITLVSAALVIALSIYNGYVELLLGGEKSFDPELVVVPKQGKTLSLSNKELRRFLQEKEILSYALQLKEKGILKTDAGEQVLEVCGIEPRQEEVFALSSFLIDGALPVVKAKEEVKESCAGFALMQENNFDLGSYNNESCRLLFPKRKGLINPLAPATAFRSCSLNFVGFLKPIREDYDRMLLVDLKTIQGLLDYKEDEGTNLVLKLNKSLGELGDLIYHLKEKVPENYKLLDREQQHPELTFLIKMEGFMVYLIMTFILLLAAFNLANGLSMLVIEKRQELDVLKALGMPRKQQERIFSLSGLFVASIGVCLGVCLGLTFCYLQKSYGFLVAYNEGDLLAQAFPIEIKWQDVLLILASNLIISLGVSLFVKHIIKKFQ